MPAEEPDFAPSDPPADSPSPVGSPRPVQAPARSDPGAGGGSTWKQAGDPASPAAAAVRYEHFEILRRADGSAWELGRGAMGVTYKALDSFLTDPNYIYHFDLGYESVLDADDGKSGVYFYDFASDDFLYTSPTFPFPYLYDFGLQSIIYYYPDPSSPGHYNTDGIRYFYVFSTGQIISK